MEIQMTRFEIIDALKEFGVSPAKAREIAIGVEEGDDFSTQRLASAVTANRERKKRQEPCNPTRPPGQAEIAQAFLDGMNGTFDRFFSVIGIKPAPPLSRALTLVKLVFVAYLVTFIVASGVILGGMAAGWW